MILYVFVGSDALVAPQISQELRSGATRALLPTAYSKQQGGKPWQERKQ